jgi:ATP-binding protein involved in chromosome partitioning
LKQTGPRLLAVGSGKGGVGKSTVVLNTAVALAEQGHRVGLIDADVHGPDIPLMLNLRRPVSAPHWNLWTRAVKRIEPVEVHGVKVASPGFIVAEDQPLAWSADLVSVLLRQFVHQVDWGVLDYLLIDLPPGTADLQQDVFRQLPDVAAMIVVTPQDAAHLDARKLLTLLQSHDVTVVGGVNNMAGLICPHGDRIEVFPPVRAERSIWSRGVERLADIAIDARVGAASDRGRPSVLVDDDSDLRTTFLKLAEHIAERMPA